MVDPACGISLLTHGLRSICRRTSMRAAGGALLVFLVAPGVASGQKTDSVWIRNGDRITGEVKSLARALLEYSTDDLGTVYIEWEKVERISSPTNFEVYLKSGAKFYGNLGLAAPGRVIIGADT